MTDFSQLRNHIQKRVELTDLEFDKFTSLLSVVRLKKKEFFARAGEVSHSEAYVNKGILRTFFTDERAHEHVIQFAMEDWWIGDLGSFLNGTPSMYSIEALEDCELFVIDQDNLERIFQAIPKFERFFRLLVQNALVAFQTRTIAVMSQSAEERFLKLVSKYPALKMRVAQQHVASYLGITPEALSRIKKHLIEKERTKM